MTEFNLEEIARGAVLFIGLAVFGGMFIMLIVESWKIRNEHKQREKEREK